MEWKEERTRRGVEEHEDDVVTGKGRLDEVAHTEALLCFEQSNERQVHEKQPATLHTGRFLVIVTTWKGSSSHYATAIVRATSSDKV